MIERDIPVDITDIQGTFLREHIAKSGCCGATELLKLYAWTLTDYHRVVHLDMDSMLLQPMDELFDKEDKTFMYTCDYGMTNKMLKACMVQGGFLLLRPNVTEFERGEANLINDIWFSQLKRCPAKTISFSAVDSSNSPAGSYTIDGPRVSWVAPTHDHDHDRSARRSALRSMYRPR